ncbi:AAA family ATPase [Zhaonella formicivorans]|uniref:AAA family ATPase n=1 Tax=Zhaonella formicivorans TaxID=2528593 RepID=UPI0010DDEA03
MLLEAGIGAGLALFLFLAMLGYNIVPFVLILGISALFYFMVVQKGMLNLQSRNRYVGVKISFDDIGGQNTAKRELIEALNFIVSGDRLQSLGIRPLKGILLTGPPGTGKTLLAKAAAAYTDAVFLSAAGSEFVEMYAGVGAQRVRDLFKQAKELAKKEKKTRAVIFIDEIEVLGVKRGSHSSHLEYDQTLNQLLVEMDGLKTSSDVKVLVIAATNRVDMLDPALLRPGRFDRQVKVDLPDKEGRLQILKIHTRNKPLDQEVDLESIAQETFGFSGAHLESLANEAAIYALRDNETTIKSHHFKEAVDKVMLGEKLDRRPTTAELERIAIHEAGHAIISETVRPGSVVHLTVTPRGQALGYMRQKPEGDSYLYTKSYLLKQIKIAVAGALAEEMILGERSTGAAGDFQEAVKLARQIVVTGLSELGIVDAEKDDQAINTKIKEILYGQVEEVKRILTAQLPLLYQVAADLKMQEKISGERLRELIATYSRCA